MLLPETAKSSDRKWLHAVARERRLTAAEVMRKRLPMAAPLIHIGMHKTGTSWLQVHLFANPASVFWNAAPDSAKPAKSRAKFGSDLFYRDVRGNTLPEEGFDAAGTRAALGADAVPQGRCLVVSHERLSGHPVSNGFDRAWIAARLHAALPEGRVLLVVREQRAMILSNYMQYLKFGGPHGIRRYMSPENDGRAPSLDLGYWNYDRLADIYIRRFGRDNLLVLPYELLRRDAADFVARICRFAGVEEPPASAAIQRENASQNYVSATGLRLISPLLRSSRGNGFAPSPFGRRAGHAVHLGLQRAIGALVPETLNEQVKRRLFAQIEEAVGDRYRESNQRLAAMTGLDLLAHGYLLPGNGAGARGPLPESDA